MTIAGVSLITTQNFHDSRGSLGVLESPKNVPFDIKRIYFLYNNSGENRGAHAHKNLQQCLICVAGSCKIYLDNGSESVSHNMDNSEECLLLNGVIWRDITDLSTDSVLLVLASDHYKKDDYLHTIDEFREWIRK